MCGIVGIISNHRHVVPPLVDALKRLEYRGYDSAGVATFHEGTLDRRRAKGKLAALDLTLTQKHLDGMIGIGHTRWATHGSPNEANAHPHMNDHVAVVHNGIIENYQEIKAALIKKGHKFASETDTEVVAHLLADYLNEGLSPSAAWQKTVGDLHGAYAIVALIKGDEENLYCARKGSPMVIGFSDDEAYIGSDAIALSGLTKKLCYLEEGDYAVVSLKETTIFDENGKSVERPITESALNTDAIEKGPFAHFMEKEIFEQPQVLQQTLANYVDLENQKIKLDALHFNLNNIPKVTIVACGTSYHAGAVARYWFERIAKIQADVDIASEFRYRDALLPEGGIALFISQSGETADTLAALRYAREKGQHIISVVNQPESSMARESDVVLNMGIGPEIGVASTKAFTGQLMVLACLVLQIAKTRGQIDDADFKDLLTSLTQIPANLGLILKDSALVENVAEKIQDVSDVLFLGRGTSFPIALEGALKLKEISYIHAEGYASGEMKHGPIALIDEKTPIVVVCPNDDLFEKSLSNVSEAAARGGQIIYLSDEAGIKALKTPALTLELPTGNILTNPIFYTVPLQLLSYYVAVMRGTDVDQPRNLAKSVTVE